MNTNEFVEKARVVHNGKYDYSTTVYSKRRSKVSIICPIHGVFEQIAEVHLYGSGCPKCAGRGKTTTDLISEFVEVHGSKYDYSKVLYTNAKERIEIVCPKHGSFWQTPNSHLNGSGCSKCAYEYRSNLHSLGVDKFILRSKEIHCCMYDYSLVNYKNSKTKVDIICHKHGVFKQTPTEHLDGSGCPKCGNERVGFNQTYTMNDFLFFSKDMHGDKYDYSKVVYTNGRTDVEIICPKHGSFAQKPFSHILGTGCPKCAKSVSSDEVRLLEYVEDWIAKHCDIKPAIVTNRSPDFFPNKQHLDIYIPDLKLAFEFNSKYWHSEKFGRGKEYHWNKFNWCKQAGVGLLNVWFEEWTKDTNDVKQIISSFLEGTLKEDVLIEKVWI